MTESNRFSLGLLRELYRHMEWADARVWSAALQLDEAAVDARLRALLHHLHETQRAFLQVWTDRPLAFGEPEAFATLRELLAWARPWYGEAQRFLEQLDNARLVQPLDLPWSIHFQQHAGTPAGVTSLGETLFQVTSHTTHHRAQVNTRLRELGVEPPLIDYIAWAWFGKPAADWTR